MDYLFLIILAIVFLIIILSSVLKNFSNSKNSYYKKLSRWRDKNTK